MKLRKLIILTFFVPMALYVTAQEPLYVGGRVTATETGYPVAQKEVSVGLAVDQPLFIGYSDVDGFYIIAIPPALLDTTATMFVWVSDCNLQIQFHSFVANPNITFNLDFEICTLNANCQASFIYNAEPSNSNLVGFENLSFPVSYSAFWFWDFGDGQTSTDFEPVHEYAQPGTYPVCLTMVDSMAGCTSVFCLDVWVAENPGECQALFTWFPEGLSVAFTDLSIGKPDNWLWNFGDGTSSGEQNPVHSWNSPGTFQVCLTIFNDSTQCQDTFCDYITIGDTLPTCHADYTYQQIEGLTLAFTNLSTGMFNEVIWDFGDGSPFSHEYNATHTWQQPGIYHVCLAIVSNYTGCQDVLCIDITVGDTLSACQAAFVALADSIPGNTNHYWFIDESTGPNISSWYWDFGDGSTSYIQHPDYTFAESGTYEVCLTTSGLGNGGYCSSTICQTITTPSYSNLGGQVFAGNFPINNPDFINDVARVTLFRKTGTKLTEVASGLYYEYGYYFFLDVMEGNYVVHTELVEGSPSFMSYIPAYTGSTHSWQSAQPVTLQGVDVFDANVYMQGMTILPGTGTGVISGNLVSLDNTLVDLGGEIIFLFQDGVIVDYVHTGIDGDFGFSALPLTAYSVSAEIAGQYSHIVEVNLTEYQNQSLGIQMEVSASGVFGIDTPQITNRPLISLYPNPADEFLNISLISKENSILFCEVISAAGSVLLRQDFTTSEGENKFTLDLQPLIPGFYLILFRTREGANFETKKFIKKR